MKKVLLALSLVVAIGATGCGQVLKSWNVGVPADNTIDASFILDPQYQLAINGSINIMNFGEIYFTPGIAGQTGTGFGVKVFTSAFLKESWVNYQLTNAMPNGVQMPYYVEQKLVAVKVPAANNPYVIPTVYFGLKDLNTNTGDYYVGVALEIPALDPIMNGGLQITQAWKNAYGEPIVGATGFGSTATGHAGIFVVSNISHVMEGQNFNPNGLKLGFDTGGIGARSLYNINQSVTKTLKSIPAQRVKTDPMKMKSIIDAHDSSIMNKMIDSGNF